MLYLILLHLIPTSLLYQFTLSHVIPESVITGSYSPFGPVSAVEIYRSWRKRQKQRQQQQPKSGLTFNQFLSARVQLQKIDGRFMQRRKK